MFGKGKRMALDAFRPIIIYTPLHLWLATNKRSFRTIIRGDKVQMPLVLGAITQMHVSLFFLSFFFQIIRYIVDIYNAHTLAPYEHTCKPKPYEHLED